MLAIVRFSSTSLLEHYLYYLLLSLSQLQASSSSLSCALSAHCPLLLQAPCPLPP